MKKIMFLGASFFQVAPIKYAKSQGHYVVTCDNVPENPGHKYADEYHNVSTVDKDKILELAKKLNIDGIVSYASDVAAPTCAYVGNKLGLPCNPYESVLTLVRKDLFRDFLKNHDFNVVEFGSFYHYEEAEIYFDSVKKPVLVKPVDSSGSKGVSLVREKNTLKLAFNQAMSYSIIKKVVIERQGYQVAGDGFMIDGKLVFRCFANEHFNKLCNPLVPIGESFPLILPELLQYKAYQEIQRLLSLLNMQIGALNFDFLFTQNDEIYILEIGPRNGGNLIPDVIKHSTGVDLIAHTVDIALGINFSEKLIMKKPIGFYSSYIIHSHKDGFLKEIIFDEDIESNILEKMFLNSMTPPCMVKRFENATFGLGALILKYESQAEMLEKMDNMDRYIHLVF